MKLLHRITRANSRGTTRVNPSDSLGQGMDAVVVLVLFFLAGFGIDRLFGTTPVFMIIMVVLAAIGLFAKFKYAYDERMDEHEAERLAKLAGTRTGTGTGSDAASADVAKREVA